MEQIEPFKHPCFFVKTTGLPGVFEVGINTKFFGQDVAQDVEAFAELQERFPDLPLSIAAKAVKDYMFAGNDWHTPDRMSWLAFMTRSFIHYVATCDSDENAERVICENPALGLVAWRMRIAAKRCVKLAAEEKMSGAEAEQKFVDESGYLIETLIGWEVDRGLQ